MNLSPTHTRLILSGVKMAHTLPSRPPMRPGEDLPLRRHPDVRLHILELADAELHLGMHRAEGFRTPVEFAASWLREHDRAWPPTQHCRDCDGDGDIDCADCWTGNVRVHPRGAHPCPVCQGSGRIPAPIEHWHVLNRFKGVHAGRPVWTVTFKLVAAPMFLARPVPGRSGDYTRNPSRAIDDLEPISLGDLRPHWRDDAVDRHEKTRDARERASRVSRSLRQL